MKCTDCKNGLAVYGKRCASCREKAIERLNADRTESAEQRQARKRRDAAQARLNRTMHP
jgi:hypothetical protein